MRPRINPKPDFERFRDVLLLKRAEKRPPIFDFIISASHISRVLDRKMKGGADVTEAMTALGYDYVQSMIYAPMDELRAATQQQRKDAGGSASHSSATKVITSLEQFKSRKWSWQPVGEGDFGAMEVQFTFLRDVVAAIPKNMKILLHTADIFTFAWEMIGFDEICFASMEEPEFPAAVMDSIAKSQLTAFDKALEIGGDKIGAMIYSDDIAYSEGLMLGPDFFRQRLFPHMQTLVEMGAKRGLPLIYHSDGRLYPVFDDLARIGVRGIQPLEPKSMDPLEIKKRWPGKFCLLGNIDLDLMSRGTADQVEKHVREKIDRLNVGGGYMPGISNTVPDYVNFDNYMRMIETVYSYG